MRRTLPLLTGLSLLCLAAVVHGVWTGRWQNSRALEEAAARVPAVPLAFGDWEGKDRPPDHEAFAGAGAKTYWMRVYRDRRSGDEVTVLLMCGPAGRMAVHTPEICYGAAGYDASGDPVREDLGPARFLTARFRKPGPAGDSALRIHWGWSADGSWQAPDSPRWTFFGEPFLYKLYVVRDATATDEPADRGTSVRFLRALLPELRKTLFAPNGAPPGKP
jgi:hypothetical protein